jgi:hypothetical protein
MPGVCDRRAAVDQPVEQREREVVAEPDQRAGGKERIQAWAGRLDLRFGPRIA